MTWDHRVYAGGWPTVRGKAHRVHPRRGCQLGGAPGVHRVLFMFTRGGVYRVVKEAMGGTMAKLSVSA